MQRPDVSKVVFFSVVTVMIVGGAFLLGLYSAARENYAYQLVRGLKQSVQSAISLVIEETPNLTRTRPVGFLQPARHEGDGVTVNETRDNDIILLSGFFDDGNELRLIERDGTILAKWPVAFSDLFPDASHSEEPPATDWNADIHGALVLPDGAVVFVFEYLGLVKLDRCGDLAWTLPRQVHHSVELAEGGGFWVPSRQYINQEGPDSYPPFPPPYYDDTIMKVSDDGEVLLEKSVVRMFYENGMEALLTATGATIGTNWQWDKEIVHLNKVTELKSAIAPDFPVFSAGDLALSIRELNMILVVDPDTEEIKWWRIGPWLRQHDPEFRPGGTITVFNNNTYRTAFTAGNDISLPSIPRVSNIIEIRPSTGEHRVLYGGRDGQRMLSVIRGKHDLTPEGGLFITEFEAGRAFETDADGQIIWEYVNRYDEDSIAEISEARVYPRTYFNVTDWACPR